MAREGADITIVYLPQEQEDAEHTKKMVEKEGRACLLISGDLVDYGVCKRAVEEHVKKYVFCPLLAVKDGANCEFREGIPVSTSLSTMPGSRSCARISKT